METPLLTVTMMVSDGTTTASHQVDVTVNGANDAPTSAAGTGSTAEDTLVTFANSDFSFSDVDGDDTAFSRIQITTLESSEISNVTTLMETTTIGKIVLLMITLLLVLH